MHKIIGKDLLNDFTKDTPGENLNTYQINSY